MPESNDKNVSNTPGNFLNYLKDVIDTNDNKADEKQVPVSGSALPTSQIHSPYMYNPYGYYYGYNVQPAFFMPSPTSSAPAQGYVNPTSYTSYGMAPGYPYYPGYVYPSAAYQKPAQSTSQPTTSRFEWWKTVPSGPAQPPPPREPPKIQRTSSFRPPPPPTVQHKIGDSKTQQNSGGFTQTRFKKPLVDSNNVPSIFRTNNDSDEDKSEATKPSLSEKKKPQASSKQNDQKRELPQSLKDYVRSSFLNCKNDKEKDKMELQVRDFLCKVLNDGSAFITNWQKIPPLRPEVPEKAPKKPLKNNKNYNSEKTKDKKKGKQGLRMLYVEPNDQKKNERRLRFIQIEDEEEELVKKPATKFDTSSSTNVQCGQNSIVGTCCALEKPYLRLTSEPDPSTVRPFDILEKAFNHILRKWNEGQPYHYVGEQLKSIRQDLTIQGIKNELTVRVYEENARIALKMGDREEFNQCQTCLKQLYDLGINGNKKEFLIYNILYMAYTSNHIEMANLLGQIKGISEDEDVKLILKLYLSFTNSNFRKFFRLYNALNMVYAKALIGLFLDDVRFNVFRILIASFSPKIKLSYVTEALGFETIEQIIPWLTSHNVEVGSQVELECKLVRSTLTK